LQPSYKQPIVKKRILVLEDDRINQELIRLYLGDEFDIKVESNVSDAINTINSSSFNLVITDLNLGHGSEGIDFLRQIRGKDATSKIPVVAYSAYHDPSEVTDLKFTAFISKPITKADFVRRIKEILVN
jgi:two-component system cell cycle response regulator